MEAKMLIKLLSALITGEHIEEYGFEAVGYGIFQKGDVILGYFAGEIVSAYTTKGNLSREFALDEDLFAESLLACPEAMEHLVREVLC